MLDVMSLREPRGTAWEATPAVAMLKRLAYRRRDRPCSRPDLDHPAVSVVGHEHATGVARDASRVFRGTMTPVQGRLGRADPDRPAPRRRRERPPGSGCPMSRDPGRDGAPLRR